MGPKKIAAYLVFAGEMREPTKAEPIAAGDAKPGMETSPSAWARSGSC